VCFESNLAEVPHNTWWIDSKCMNHVSNIVHGFLTIQTISPNEKFVFMGNRVKAPMEAVETYRLKLDIEHHLDLLEILYVPILSRNLVSLSKIDVTGYSFNFVNGCFSLFKHNYLIGTSVLCDGLYKLKLDGLYVEAMTSKIILMISENQELSKFQRIRSQKASRIKFQRIKFQDSRTIKFRESRFKNNQDQDSRIKRRLNQDKY